MKFTILTLLFIFLGCSNDKIQRDPIFKLPPETQVGANTFGVTIKGKVYVPRTPTGFDVEGQGRAVYFKGLDTATWREIVVLDGASSVGFKMVIHFSDLESLGAGVYTLKQSDFRENIDSSPINHIYFKIFDTAIGNYAYYGSIENQGEIKVTRFDGSVSENWIISGNFNGKFARYDNPKEVIAITDGRFDLNLNTLNTHLFP